MIHTRKRIYVVVAVFILTALACNLPSQKAPPPTAIPLTNEEMQQFEESLQATLENPQPGGEVNITMSEQQLSSYIATKLSEQPEQIISSPRVRLTGGRMELWGQVTQGSITTEAVAVIQPSVNAGGAPQLKVESMTVGAVPVPDVALNQVQELVDTVLIDYVHTENARYTITKIEILEGQLSMTGIIQ